LLCRSEAGMFVSLARHRRIADGSRRPDNGGSSSEDDTADQAQSYTPTFFDDPRWQSIPLRVMPTRDISVHRSAAISINAVIGCTRHGILRLA
jgi:hypothetical protein